MSDLPARYPDLRTGGRDLAAALEAFGGGADAVVLGLVLGGVPVAHEVARLLRLPLDLVVLRRLLAPQGPGSVACAFDVAGTRVLDDALPPRPDGPASPLDHFLSDALDGLARRARTCRGERPALDLAGRTVLLVDCGMRTGGTMRAAVRALRTMGPARIVAAVPVAAAESRATVEAVADTVVCPRWLHPFAHVGMGYRDFRRPGDAEVSALLG